MRVFSYELTYMKTQAVRLMDKTVIFYISNTGSIPVPPTNNIIQLIAEYEVLSP